MRTFIFDVEIEHEEDGRWSASIPALVGCATWGYTKDEALNSLREAAKAYLEVLAEKGTSLKELTRRTKVLPENAITVTV